MRAEVVVGSFLLFTKFIRRRNFGAFNPALRQALNVISHSPDQKFRLISGANLCRMKKQR